MDIVISPTVVLLERPSAVRPGSDTCEGAVEPPVDEIAHRVEVQRFGQRNHLVAEIGPVGTLRQVVVTLKEHGVLAASIGRLGRGSRRDAIQPDLEVASAHAERFSMAVPGSIECADPQPPSFTARDYLTSSSIGHDRIRGIARPRLPRSTGRRTPSTHPSARRFDHGTALAEKVLRRTAGGRLDSDSMPAEYPLIDARCPGQRFRGKPIAPEPGFALWSSARPSGPGSAQREPTLGRPLFPNSIEPGCVVMDGSHRTGWPDPPILLSSHPQASVLSVGLHYGQIAFEGLRVRSRLSDGMLEVFRADLHWERLTRSMARLSMPVIDRPTFDVALGTLLEGISGRSPRGAEEFLYIRPLVVAMDSDWSMGGSESFRFYLLAGWTREAFSRIPRVVARVEANQRRAWPGGTGDVKIPGNYGIALAAQQRAREVGAHTVLWLDPSDRSVEEFSSMNALFLDDRGQLWAPPPGMTILDGVTRRSILELAGDAGIAIREAPLRWPDLSHRTLGPSGTLLATGTAAGLVVIDEVRERSRNREDWSWKSSPPDKHLADLRELTDACFRRDSRPDWWVDATQLVDGAKVVLKDVGSPDADSC